MTPLALLIAFESSGHACPGDSVRTQGTRVTAKNAAHCAKARRVVGAHCSYATVVLARRVLEQGEVVAAELSLTPADDDRPGGASAPYRISDDAGAHVLANELVEHIVQNQWLNHPLTVEGRALEVDGTRFLVLTSYEIPAQGG